MTYRITLPFPPSLSQYYDNVRLPSSKGKVYTGKKISAKGEAFRGETMVRVRKGGKRPPRFAGRLSIVVFAAGPERKANGAINNNPFDLDNLFKCLLDSLTYAGVVGDDSQFDHIEMMRLPRNGKGFVDVVIEKRSADAETA